MDTQLLKNRKLNYGKYLIGINVPSDLSATRRQVLEGHFGWKPGINSRFPTTHPFRNTPPLASSWI